MKSVVVIGGGFFGMFIAEHLARCGNKVSIIEKNPDFMQRASYVNQARVHNGYHYPRSILTALRSRISFPRFVQEFKSCIDDRFEKYYMVGKLLGKVTARQFEQFCSRIGAPCELAPTRITRLINSDLIEAVYLTTEYAFDAVKLKEQMEARLDAAGVAIRLNTQATKIHATRDGRLTVDMITADDQTCAFDGVDHVFNCTYSMINKVNLELGVDLIPLKHEIAEICLVEVPDVLKDCGFTVMCGPFFSLMPFPSKDCHSFSHVRYTPHCEWADEQKETYIDAHQYYNHVKKVSAWDAMWRDAKRYMPILQDMRHINSIWEVKTILPRSESDDSRPILFKPNHGIKGFHCVMGGKIDNVYDAVREIDRIGLIEQD